MKDATSEPRHKNLRDLTSLLRIHATIDSCLSSTLMCALHELEKDFSKNTTRLLPHGCCSCDTRALVQSRIRLLIWVVVSMRSTCDYDSTFSANLKVVLESLWPYFGENVGYLINSTFDGKNIVIFGLENSKVWICCFPLADIPFYF